MAYVPHLEVALALGLQLALEDRLKLIEGLVSSIEREIKHEASSDKTCGANNSFALLSELDLSEWEIIGADDPVKWVKQLRRKGD